MMDGPHEIVGRAGNHRHRVARPKPGKTKKPIIAKVNESRLFVRPLITTIGGNQASAGFEGFAERRLDRHGFTLGIEYPF